MRKFMKKFNICFFLLIFYFFSCNQITFLNESENSSSNSSSSKRENSFVTITAIIPNAQRSATTNLSDLTYHVIAIANEDNKIEENFDNSQFKIALSDSFIWDVTISAKKENDILFIGKKQIDPKTTISMSVPLELYKNYTNGEKGSIKLPFSSENPDFTYSVDFFNHTKNSTYSGTQEISSQNFIPLSTPITVDSVTPGTYWLQIRIFNLENELQYFLSTAITVFPNCQTNIWKEEDGISENGTLNISNEMIEKFKYSTYYVNAQTGNDENLGGPYTPLKTVKKAFSKCNDSTKNFTIFIDENITEVNEILVNSKSVTIKSLQENNNSKIKGLTFKVDSNHQLDLQNIDFASKIEIENDGKLTFNEKTNFTDEVEIQLKNTNLDLSNNIELNNLKLTIKSEPKEITEINEYSGLTEIIGYEQNSSLNLGVNQIIVEDDSELILEGIKIKGTSPSELKGNICSKGKLSIQKSQIDCSLELINSSYRLLWNDYNSYSENCVFYLDKSLMTDGKEENDFHNYFFTSPIKFISINKTEKSEIKLQNTLIFNDSIEMEGIKVTNIEKEKYSPTVYSENKTVLKNCEFEIPTWFEGEISFDENTIFNENCDIQLKNSSLEIPCDMKIKHDFTVYGNNGTEKIILGNNKIIVEDDRQAYCVFSNVIIENDKNITNFESFGYLCIQDSEFDGKIINHNGLTLQTSKISGIIETDKDINISNDIVFEDFKFILNNATVKFYIYDDDFEFNSPVEIVKKESSTGESKILLDDFGIIGPIVSTSSLKLEGITVEMDIKSFGTMEIQNSKLNNKIESTGDLQIKNSDINNQLISSGDLELNNSNIFGNLDIQKGTFILRNGTNFETGSSIKLNNIDEIDNTQTYITTSEKINATTDIELELTNYDRNAIVLKSCDDYILTEDDCTKFRFKNLDYQIKLNNNNGVVLPPPAVSIDTIHTLEFTYEKLEEKKIKISIIAKNENGVELDITEFLENFHVQLMQQNNVLVEKTATEKINNVELDLSEILDGNYQLFMRADINGERFSKQEFLILGD